MPMDQLRSGSVNMKKTNQHPSFFISCDWGTSRFRMSLVRSNPVENICSISDTDGIKKVHKAWKKTGQLNQEKYFTEILRNKIAQLCNKTNTNHQLDSLPVIISGMASSELGLRHLPYQPLPIFAEANHLITKRILANPQFNHEIYLVSGLKTNDEVMRGEETLLLGVITKYQIKNGIVILPGTHSKHIYIADGVINDFTTFMTGELFELLSRQSILSETVEMPSNWSDKKGFKDGLNDSKHQSFMSQLFKIRSASLLHHKKGTYNFFRLSGQLIGSELKSLLPHRPENIYIAGEPKLLSLYKLACEHYNFPRQITKQSDNLLAAGHQQILYSIINNT